MRFAYVVIAGCAGSAPLVQPPRDELSATQWTRRCGDRIELARMMLVRYEPAFVDATLAIDTSPWNPSLRFEARRGADYWQASVQHGRGACIDFDIDDDSYNNMAWRDGSSADRVLVDRIMRLDGDEAWLQANDTLVTTAYAFRRELEFALRECLLDAQGVALVDPPAGLCNFDQDDRCPDEPTDADDGCPAP
jgi:hypothetical protein